MRIIRFKEVKRWPDIQNGITLKERKGVQDKKNCGKIFQKLVKEIYQAAQRWWADPETNSALRLAMDKAKANNMPNDNVDRCH